MTNSRGVCYNKLAGEDTHNKKRMQKRMQISLEQENRQENNFLLLASDFLASNSTPITKNVCKFYMKREKKGDDTH